MVTPHAIRWELRYLLRAVRTALRQSANAAVWPARAADTSALRTPRCSSTSRKRSPRLVHLIDARGEFAPLERQPVESAEVQSMQQRRELGGTKARPQPRIVAAERAAGQNIGRGAPAGGTQQTACAFDPKLARGRRLSRPEAKQLPRSRLDARVGRASAGWAM